MQTSQLSIILSTFFYATLLIAETSQEKGRRIAEEADKYHAGYGDYSVNGEMILTDASKRSTTRTMDLKFLEGNNGEDRTLIVFSKPADIKGSALLTYVKPGADDDQFLYLPAIKRVKRIVASNRTSAFLGSEFSFEDMAPKLVDDFSYNFIKQAKCASKGNCWVIDAFPIARETAYSKQELWIDQKNYLLVKIRYFDRKKKHIKTLINSKPKQFKKKYWNFLKTEMTNHQTKKSTTFKYQQYKYRVGLGVNDFEQNVLKRLH